MIHKGVAIENNPALLDAPNDNKELQIVYQLLGKVYQADATFWQRAARACMAGYTVCTVESVYRSTVHINRSITGIDRHMTFTPALPPVQQQ